MNVLVVGAGGREHALAHTITQSPQVARVFVAPGNGGTAQIAENVPIPGTDLSGLVNFAREKGIDLTVVGPEVPLSAGIVDRFEEAGLRIFGPTSAAAQIEASKAFARQFMAEVGIPSGRFAVFNDFEAARGHLRQVDYPVVVKASGLAAGKGVIVPSTREEAEHALRRMLLDRAFGEAGAQVVVEERLSGPEVSVLAFSDGRTVVPMPPAQDHKRAYDNDQGPNTGGMGAYAPAPIAPPDVIDVVRRSILQPAVDGLRDRGIPYVGVLYAGLMLTDEGPRVLEFNCRFGDPETQVILPLLETDLIDIVQACIDGRLDSVAVRWRQGIAATVVLASGGYPGSYRKGYPIQGLDDAAAMEGVLVFHAGTARRNCDVVTSGGRVLNVTGLGEDLGEALERAYGAVRCVHFTDMHYRHDIGAQAMEKA